ncbi:lamin tail domain-containing protein [Streptomyces bauhiniae]|uniref:lamin tail domain-containing protein n=1 Tax=Streptomyces bauhiniae TaxID=2340725 RepID=UPI0035DD272E
MTSSSVTARRLAAAALAAGALVGAAALPATAADRSYRENVEISRVQYDSPGWDNGSNRSLNNEWVEVTNNSRHRVNLDGWRLTEDRRGVTYTFSDFTLGGHETVRIHTGIGRDTYRDLFQDRRNYVWDNRRDTATLRNDERRFVDSVTWGGRDDRWDDNRDNDGWGHGGWGHGGWGHDNRNHDDRDNGGHDHDGRGHDHEGRGHDHR